MLILDRLLKNRKTQMLLSLVRGIDSLVQKNFMTISKPLDEFEVQERQ